LLLQGQHQCVLVALAKTVSQFPHNCTHIHPAPAHRVSYLHSLVLPCEAGTNFTYTSIIEHLLVEYFLRKRWDASSVMYPGVIGCFGSIRTSDTLPQATQPGMISPRLASQQHLTTGPPFSARAT